MLVLLDLRVVRITLPAMVALGPLMVAQYVFWSRRLGVERTRWQYQLAEPHGGRLAISAPGALPAASIADIYHVLAQNWRG